MDILVLKNYYSKRGLSEKETESAVLALGNFQNKGVAIENCTVSQIKSYIQELIEAGENAPADLLALARAAYLCNNREVYIYFTQIVERDSIISNLKEHMVNVLGEEKTESLFSGLRPPVPGAPPEDAFSYTRELLTRMDKTLSQQECSRALTANAHGIPPRAFTAEVEKFKASENLKAYLEDAHRRSVATLQDHADSGEVWFEQIITQPVVDFVKSDREILGGVLKEGKIYWTKIPYDVEAWLSESDEGKKRYYACHCPMAREVLLQKEESIPKMWCNCTSGFVQQRFKAIFGEDVQVDCLESVLDGDKRCRFAIHVPERFIP